VIQSEPKLYQIQKLGASPIQVDGRLEKVWDKAITLSDLTAPWDERLSFTNHFRALHDKNNIYFAFTVEDDDLYLEQNYDDEESNAVRSDRVELFFRQADQSSPYYSLEMDADGRLFDSKAVFNQGIDESWDVDTNGFNTQTTMTDSGYILEGVIAKKVLHELGLISSDGIILTGIYRANYHSDTSKVEWITWVNPQTEKPNFHILFSFGKMVLLE